MNFVYVKDNVRLRQAVSKVSVEDLVCEERGEVQSK